MREVFAEAGPALLQVTLVGIVLGAGLPALFALGMKSLGAGRTVSADGSTFVSGPTLPGKVGAAVCFSVVVAAALFGIVIIVFGKQMFAS